MEDKIIILDEITEKGLKEIWFIFGNTGKYTTMARHKFIQQIYQYRDGNIEGLAKHYKIKKKNPVYLIVASIINGCEITTKEDCLNDYAFLSDVDLPQKKYLEDSYCYRYGVDLNQMEKDVKLLLGT